MTLAVRLQQPHHPPTHLRRNSGPLLDAPLRRDPALAGGAAVEVRVLQGQDGKDRDGGAQCAQERIWTLGLGSRGQACRPGLPQSTTDQLPQLPQPRPLPSPPRPAKAAALTSAAMVRLSASCSAALWAASTAARPCACWRLTSAASRCARRRASASTSAAAWGREAVSGRAARRQAGASHSFVTTLSQQCDCQWDVQSHSVLAKQPSGPPGGM